MIKILISILAVVAGGFTIFKVLGENRSGEANTTGGGRPVRFTPISVAYGVAGLALVAAAGFYFWQRNTPEAPREGPIWNDAALGGGGAGSAPPIAGGAPQLDDVDTMITRLAERLQKDGNDAEGWRMLGWSYFNTGRKDEAVKAYARAVALLPDRPDIRAAYGEAMVAAAGDKVTPAARAQFDQVLHRDAKEPRARFYMALEQAQNGHEREALDRWIEIANEPPRDQMWSSGIRKRITDLAAKLGVDISGRLKGEASPAAGASSGPSEADVKAADAMSPTDRNTMIRGMVDRLASRLASNPNDVDGWIKLLRSRMVLGDTERARSEYALARKAVAGNATSLSRLDEAARGLGLAAR